MPSTILTVLDQQIEPVTPTFTSWFSGCQFLVFQSSLVGEYIATGEFLEVAVALFAEVVPGPIAAIERLVDWQDSINTIDLIMLPEKFRNDCFPMRLLINPSTGFHARILAISC
ncbi:hypothetical protein [Microcoleus sp. D2_18a_D3]|uniref:hypothetical protein n=1 Tax=Microcoleus sp. D2_18a_D3 TaxID=3055330 RepID=UPI002FD2F10C